MEKEFWKHTNSPFQIFSRRMSRTHREGPNDLMHGKNILSIHIRVKIVPVPTNHSANLESLSLTKAFRRVLPQKWRIMAIDSTLLL